MSLDLSSPKPNVRRRLTHGIGLAVLAALPALLGACSVTGNSAWNTLHASAGLGYFENTLDGSVETNTEVSPGMFVKSTFDYDDNGGQDGSAEIVYATAQVGIAPLELRLSAFEYDQDGTGTFNGDFLDQTFTGMVQTDFKFATYKGTLGLDLINLERFRIGILAGATVFDIDLQIEEIFGTVSDTSTEVFPVPVVGARADLKILDSLRVGGEFTIFPLEEVEDLDVEFFDLEVGIHFEPLPYLEIFGLYRMIDLEADGEIDDVDAVVDIMFEGPIIGAAITF